MRKYIFTEIERRSLEAWLAGGKEDVETRKLFVRIRRNLNTLRSEVELLSRGANRLSKEGRLMGRVRIHEKPLSQSSPSE